MSHPHHQRSLLCRLIEQPQRVWLRRAFFQIHLWTGILLVLYVIVIGITGSVLVFKDELAPRPRSAVAAQDLRHCAPEQLAQAIDTVTRAYPSRQVNLASCPTQADPFFAVTAIAKQHTTPDTLPKNFVVYVNPATNTIAGTADTAHSWLRWVDDLHVYLFLGRSGMIWNGIAAGILLLLVLTGIVLWWPGIRRWRRSLTLNLRHNWRRLNWDLHSVVGIWTVFFTLTWATTGMYFAWPKLTASAIERVSPITTARYPAAEIAAASKAAEHAPAVPFDLITILQQARQSSPQAALEGVFYGSGPHPIFTVYMAQGRLGDYANTHFIYFDQSSGQFLLDWHRGDNRTLGDWLLWLAVPLHFGASWGFAFKLLWSALGLALPLLAITGLLMYWNRYLRRRFLRAHPAQNSDPQLETHS